MTNQLVPCLTISHASMTPPGVVVFGKTLDATRHVHAQFRRRTVDKRYLALVAGIPESADFVVDAPIDRHPVDKCAGSKLMLMSHRLAAARTQEMLRGSCSCFTAMCTVVCTVP